MIGVFMTIQSEYGIRRPIDDSLIEKISNGDTDAFRELYESASKSVYGFALSILKNRYDAEDVLQDTFLRVYKNASGYKAKGKPMAWMLRITKNLALTRLREKSKNEEYNLSAEAPDFSFVENTDSRLLLEKLFTILSDDEKQIVVLHVTGGLKHRETAEILELPLGTVLAKYNRAIKKLRTETEE